MSSRDTTADSKTADVADSTSTRDYLPDRQRRQRIGLVEAVFCETKSDDQITMILRDAEANQQRQLMTRLQESQYHEISTDLRANLDYDPVSRTAWYGEPDKANATARVAIVTGGTSDAPAAREAARTLLWHGYAVEEMSDVGVAGLWRLTERIDSIAQFPVVIAVAGMDAAMPTVLGGLIGSAIIAVPTSTGYGAAQGGHSALNALLASCAPGVTVVNIDNGYGAACAAIRILLAIPAAD